MEGLGLYIHFPFCVRKCLYCDFLSRPGSEEEKRAYLKALSEEIVRRAPWVSDSARCAGGAGRSVPYAPDYRRDSFRQSDSGHTVPYFPDRPEYEVDTIYFGGGTPSVMPADGLRGIYELIRQNFHLAPDAEISMEMNPGTVTPEFAACVSGFVNRVSLGVQSANDSELAAVGRIHCFEDARRSAAILREAGIENLNVDLMYGLPQQTKQSFAHTLEEIQKLEPEHISCYSLILEEGTELARRVSRGEVILPSEEEERDMAYLAAGYLTGRTVPSYRQYEFSNFARSGYECRHNLRYWKRRPYLGFGPGAASFFRNTRWTNTTDIEKYIAAMSQGDPLRVVTEEPEVVSREAAMEEFMFLGLRMTDGILSRDFMDAFGVPLEEVYGGAIRKHIEGGFMKEATPGQYCLTGRGVEVSNVILADYLLDET